MTAIPLSEYYNKLVRVQRRVRNTRALHSEIFHHLNNGAANLIIFMGGSRMPQEKSSALIQIARDIASEVSRESQTIMDRVSSDEAQLKSKTLLVDLVLGNYTPDQTELDDLCAFNQRLHTDAESLRFLRTKAEVNMLERSGMITAPIDLARMPVGAFSLADYYNRLAHVQMAAKVVTDERAAISRHMNASATRIRDHIGKHDVDGVMAEAFTLAETEIAQAVTGQMVTLMAPLTVELQEHNITSLRLVNLIRKPEVMTPENYEFLADLDGRIAALSGKFADIRRDTEVKMLKASGLVSRNFTL